MEHRPDGALYELTSDQQREATKLILIVSAIKWLVMKIDALNDMLWDVVRS